MAFRPSQAFLALGLIAIASTVAVLMLTRSVAHRACVSSTSKQKVAPAHDVAYGSILQSAQPRTPQADRPCLPCREIRMEDRKPPRRSCSEAWSAAEAAEEEFLASHVRICTAVAHHGVTSSCGQVELRKKAAIPNTSYGVLRTTPLFFDFWEPFHTCDAWRFGGHGVYAGEFVCRAPMPAAGRRCSVYSVYSGVEGRTIDDAAPQSAVEPWELHMIRATDCDVYVYGDAPAPLAEKLRQAARSTLMQSRLKLMEFQPSVFIQTGFPARLEVLRLRIAELSLQAAVIEMVNATNVDQLMTTITVPAEPAVATNKTNALFTTLRRSVAPMES